MYAHRCAASRLDTVDLPTGRPSTGPHIARPYVFLHVSSSAYLTIAGDSAPSGLHSSQSMPSLWWPAANRGGDLPPARPSRPPQPTAAVPKPGAVTTSLTGRRPRVVSLRSPVRRSQPDRPIEVAPAADRVADPHHPPYDVFAPLVQAHSTWGLPGVHHPNESNLAGRPPSRPPAAVVSCAGWPHHPAL